MCFRFRLCRMNDSWSSYEDLEEWSSMLNATFWIDKNETYSENDGTSFKHDFLRKIKENK